MCCLHHNAVALMMEAISTSETSVNVSPYGAISIHTYPDDDGSKHRCTISQYLYQTRPPNSREDSHLRDAVCTMQCVNFKDRRDAVSWDKPNRPQLSL
jgi:hypothetical protein